MVYQRLLVLPSAELQSVYFAALADWAGRLTEFGMYTY